MGFQNEMIKQSILPTSHGQSTTTGYFNSQYNSQMEPIKEQVETIPSTTRNDNDNSHGQSQNTNNGGQSQVTSNGKGRSQSDLRYESQRVPDHKRIKSSQEKEIGQDSYNNRFQSLIEVTSQGSHTGSAPQFANLRSKSQKSIYSRDQSMHNSHVSRNSTKSLNQLRSDGSNGTQPLVSHIHYIGDEYSRQPKSRQDPNNNTITAFAMQFQKLYDNISKIYPQFKQETRSSVVVDRRLTQGDKLPALQMFDQIKFLYTKVKDLKVKDAKRDVETRPNSRTQSVRGSFGPLNDTELDNIMVDQANTANNFIKMQLETTQRERDQLKANIEKMKVQLKSNNELIQQDQSHLREQEYKYEQKLQQMIDQVQIQTEAIETLQRRNSQLHSEHNEALGMMEDAKRLMNQAKSEHLTNTNQLPTLSPRECFKCQMRLTDNLMNDDDQQTALRNQVKELKYANDEMRPRIQMQEAQLQVEREKNEDLMQRNDQLKQCFDSDKGALEMQIRQIEIECNAKQDTIEQLYEQIDEISQTVNMEFPIISNPAHTAQFNGTLKKQHVQMKRSGFESKLDYHQDDLFNEFEDEFDLKFARNKNMPRKTAGSGLNFKKNSRSNSRTGGRSTATSSQKNAQAQVVSMFNLEQFAHTQINAVIMSDKILKELKDSKEDKKWRIDQELELYNKIEEKMNTFQEERKKYQGKQQNLISENDQLKLKFSNLLDQFQEYVNQTEQKMQNEQSLQKKEQENLLKELNTTISELQDMSEQLKTDIKTKAEEIERLQKTNEDLSKELETVKDKDNQQISQRENLQLAKISSLNEEINYLKDHYMVEMDALREELNGIRDQQDRRFRQSISASPKNYNEFGHRNSTHVSEASQMMIYDEYGQECPQPYPEFNRSRKQYNRTPNPCTQSRDQINQRSMEKEQRYSRHNYDQYMQDASNQNIHSNEMNPNEQIYSQHQDSFGQSMGLNAQSNPKRAKSFDRATYKQYQRPRSNSRHHVRRNSPYQYPVSQQKSDRGRNSAFSDRSRNSSFKQGQGPYQMQISRAQSNYDQLKQELENKDILITQNIHLISSLQQQLDEYKLGSQSTIVTQQQRVMLIQEFEKVTENLKIELERSKINLENQQSPQSVIPFLIGHKNSQQESKTENINIVDENTLRGILIEKISTLRDLVTLASEIFLLSSKQKYLNEKVQRNYEMPMQQHEQNNIESQMQKLRNDNTLMQQSVFQYEQTLAGLDQIFRREDSKDEVIYQLKKMTERQLQDIIQLQQQQSQDQDIAGIMQENQVLKQEIAMLRENSARKERILGDQQTMHIEELEQEKNNAILQMQDKEAYLEGVRQRITSVAEFFEKKPIKQKYSFEVLCDFINDKAKRLFNKYETAMKDKKQLQQDSATMKQRLAQLEKETTTQNDIITLLKNYIVPRMVILAGKKYQSNELSKLSVNLLRELFDDLDYQLKNRQLDFTSRSQERQNSFVARGNRNELRSNFGADKTHHTLDISSPNRSELEQIKQEKLKLSQKLDKISLMLKDFQDNQKQYINENMQLKQKIGQLEQIGQIRSRSQNHHDMNSSYHATQRNFDNPQYLDAQSSGHQRQNSMHRSQKGGKTNYTTGVINSSMKPHSYETYSAEHRTQDARATEFITQINHN